MLLCMPLLNVLRKKRNRATQLSRHKTLLPRMIKVRPFPIHLLPDGPVPSWLPQERIAPWAPRMPPGSTTGPRRSKLKRGAWVKTLHRRIKQKIKQKRSRGAKKTRRERRRERAPWRKLQLNRKRRARKRKRGEWREGRGAQ